MALQSPAHTQPMTQPMTQPKTTPVSSMVGTVHLQAASTGTKDFDKKTLINVVSLNIYDITGA